MLWIALVAALPRLSAQPVSYTVERNVQMPMRDGIRLVADIYRPEKPGPVPIVLMRTPYKKEAMQSAGIYYARHGYAGVVQDVRGRFGSAGQWEPFVNEARDGYDTIEWLAARPWSNGKVGMIGGSYLAWVQWFAATLRPPHLTTIIPNVSPSDPFHNMPYDNGVLFLTGTFLWTSIIESGATNSNTDQALYNAVNKRFGSLLGSLPVIDLDKSVLGHDSRFWRAWLAHPSPRDPYWKETLYLDRLKKVEIPVFHQTGWFDGDSIGTELNYLRMTAHRHRYQKLTIGPWPHSERATRGIWGHDFGAQALVDMEAQYLRWFDYWLKGIDTGILKESLVHVFSMGMNQWIAADRYPLPGTRYEKLYLSSGGRANTSQGDGKLRFTPPAAGEPPDRYVYDPGDPTPDPSFYEPRDGAGTVDQVRREAEERRALVTRDRRDLLVYTSEPFDRAYSVVGPVSAVIYAASSARDTDWFVHFVEVDEAGKFLPLIGADAGKVRARFRRSLSKPKLLKPGKVYRYQIDLWQTGITVRPGHRLRIEIASADFPTYSRNLNTGGNNETDTRFIAAHQEVYHDARHASYLLLPHVPDPAITPQNKNRVAPAGTGTTR